MQNRCPECGTTLTRGVPERARQLTVADAMTKEPITLGPEDSLIKAVEVMRKRKIRRLPVVVADTLVGLLAEGDLKRAQPSALSDSEEEFHQVMETTPISRIMIQRPLTTTEDVPLVDAAQTLHTTKYGALPVLRDGKLIGILTDNDLAAVLVGLLGQGG